MLTVSFWKGAAERVVRTIAQTLLALWLVGDLAFNALDVDWGEALGVSLGAGILSLLTSLVAVGIDPSTGPSLGTERPVSPGTRRARPGDVGPEAGASEVAVILIVLGVLLVILDLFVTAGGMIALTVLGVCLIVGGVVLALLRR